MNFNIEEEVNSGNAIIKIYQGEQPAKPEDAMSENLILSIGKEVGFAADIVPSLPNPFDIESVKVHFSRYLEKVDEMYSLAEALVVDNDERNGEATALGTSAMKLYKKIDEVKDGLVGEILTEEVENYLQAIRQTAKTLTEKLYSTNKKNLTVVSIAKNKIAQFIAFKEQQRQEAELVAKKATEELQKKLDDKAKEIGTTAPTVAQPVFRKSETVTRTETGSSYTGDSWTFEILEPHYARQLIADLQNQWVKLVNTQQGEMNQAQCNVTDSIKELTLASPYLILSETEIRRAIKGGIREMGKSIKIYQKTNVSFRT